MLFHTAQFGLFLIAVLGLSAVLSDHRSARHVMLLVASYIFYAAWSVKYLGLIVFSTLLDYVIGDAIWRTKDPRWRKILLGLSLTGNLGVLAVFKYYGFFAENLQTLLNTVGLQVSMPVLHVLLPVGISFYTFQSLSYTIDIYRGELEPRRNLVEFAMFVAFFPQLVAGPIVRAREFLPQLENDSGPDGRQSSTGIYLILKGLIKKVLIADILAVYLVDPIFREPAKFGAFAILAAIYGFKFQIYNDFSGYTDIARGTGRLLGYELPINFRSPFKAWSIPEYWRRWHITMSTWFRDYLFYPLGGSRHGVVRTCCYALITMAVIGLWHGAAWNFVLWGTYYGVLLSFSIIVRHLRSRHRGTEQTLEVSGLRRFFQVVLIFHLTLIAGVLFRSPSLATVRDMWVASWDRLVGPGVSTEFLLLLVLAMVLHFAPEAFKDGAEERFSRLHPIVQGAVAALVIGIVSAMMGATNPYYYFQF
jgi:D-alanyl-lipoteichoic acid acyltransferase DltB (MBOAT superfamily)